MNTQVAEKLGLLQAARAVHQIWYAYAEGYLPTVTGTEQDEALFSRIDSTMPEGWTASIAQDGTVYASRPVLLDGQVTAIILREDRSGRRHILKAPIQ